MRGASAGVVERVHGGFVFPDSNAHVQGENPQWVYTVRVRRAGSCGARTPTRRSASSVDCWEPYLEPAA